eukprot:gnl/TRDRNA2_/TRDRNA2_183033_c0_seq1.p1 gnl/TRDRNA2_/TRDRNA2_183033_c0~~gnl/TRDRNA2_/TRDRNA2_183033_c0_seq1.p1  ORF type:complete len:1043 (-),score=205.40 gnl/TRDRNA2_/TRDRNA2_183033_c0_seq1:217-3345(-)
MAPTLDSTVAHSCFSCSEAKEQSQSDIAEVAVDLFVTDAADGAAGPGSPPAAALENDFRFDCHKAWTAEADVSYTDKRIEQSSPARLPQRLTTTEQGLYPVIIDYNNPTVARPAWSRGDQQHSRTASPDVSACRRRTSLSGTSTSPNSGSTSARRPPGMPVTSPPHSSGTCRASYSSKPDASPKGDVLLCVRLRPGSGHEAPAASVEAGGCIRLHGPVPSQLGPGGPRAEQCETSYRCDRAFGPETTQEHVFSQSVSPICDVVLRGYNGAVIAYGQTGSGKTHTMLGDLYGKGQGIAPRAVAAIFGALQKCPVWQVEVSVLEIYNERVRDLLAPGGVTHVDIHEVRTSERDPATFRCPDATMRSAAGPDAALAALQEGMRRRETARTDMNHSSSRSHLIFTLCVSQSDREAGATLRSRLYLVDLAGSERLKRSMADSGPSPSATAGNLSARQSTKANGISTMSPRSPRDQRREASEINKSLSQLALVIQRLTTAGAAQHIPYRDSALTRLLAESFGGSSKTCLIIAASPAAEDREETKCSLEFGKRAKLVRNTPEINLEIETEPSMVFQALLSKEVAQLRTERSSLEERLMSAERRLADTLTQRDEAEAAKAALVSESQQADVDRLQLQDEIDAMQRSLNESQDAATEARKAQAALEAKFSALRTDLKASNENAAMLEGVRDELQRRLQEARASLVDAQEASALKVERLETEKFELCKRVREAAAEHASAEEEKARKIKHAEAELQRRYEFEAAEASRLRQSQEQLLRKLKAKANEVSRLESEKAQLQRKLEEETARWDTEQAAANARLEVEKIQVHQQWQEATAQAWRVLQERAPCVISPPQPSPPAPAPVPAFATRGDVDKSISTCSGSSSWSLMPGLELELEPDESLDRKAACSNAQAPVEKWRRQGEVPPLALAMEKALQEERAYIAQTSFCHQQALPDGSCGIVRRLVDVLEGGTVSRNASETPTFGSALLASGELTGRSVSAYADGILKDEKVSEQPIRYVEYFDEQDHEGEFGEIEDESGAEGEVEIQVPLFARG